MKPEVGASSDTWGSKLNSDLDWVDQFLGAITTAGGTTAYTLTTSSGLGAYVTGMSFLIKMNATNTGASTLNVDGLGAKNMTKNGATATALASGNLVSGNIYHVVYDSMQFQVTEFTSDNISQPIDATLTAFAAQTTGADLLWYWTGTDAGATTAFDVAARTWLAQTSLSSYVMVFDDNGSAGGPVLILDRNSASPAASDEIGILRFRGRDSAANSHTYGFITARIVDPTNGSEDGALAFYASVASSTSSPSVYIGAGIYSPNATGGDKGADSANFSTLYEQNVRVATLGANTHTAAQTIAVTAAGTALTLESTDAGATAGPTLDLFRNSASPAAADILGGFIWSAKDSGGNTLTYASMNYIIDSPTDGAEDGYLQFNNRLDGGALASRLRIAAGIYHASATGGDKGNNTINFGALYDDNTLLTDYVFDAYLGGEPAAPYSERVREKANALNHGMFDPATYADFWKANRRLYGMPDLNDCIDGIVKEHSLGAQIQMLTQTVELQAIHIEALRQKLEEK